MAGRWDPTGTLVVGLRACAEVIEALTAVGGDTDYRRVSAGEAKLPPPHVVVVNQGVNPQPFGLGTRRVGLARHQYAFRCVAPATLENGSANAQGPAQAGLLAGAVATFLARRGWTTRTIDGSVYATVGPREDVTTGSQQDPDTKDPFVVVQGSIVAAAQAVG